ncbi:ferredoxin [Salinigranum rubrum]|uniref:Ferredoxin n=1 Tax=Salinigranum rubrum TaxID=755307 RepID=A0A2I8VFG9_9EURY|nr:ferredoxin Fer [Salinigranum rubrum]AUV80682.1 ferredoxin [Salinigranum rubrum]
MDTPFDVLQVDPDASDEVIDRAYRRRVLETHPDQGGSAEEFQRVRRAYERIKSGEKRAMLEEGWESPTPDPEAATNGEAKTESADTDDGDEDNGDDERDEPEAGVDGKRVEFLNYDVLSDHGWSLDDDDLFEKASEADLAPEDYGRVLVKPRESLLEAAEERGFTWPYSCRGGACANCAVAVVEGEMEMPAGQILTPEFIDQGIRLSCISAPTTDEAKVVFNVKHLPGLDELRLPPRQFDGPQAND